MGGLLSIHIRSKGQIVRRFNLEGSCQSQNLSRSFIVTCSSVFHIQGSLRPHLSTISDSIFVVSGVVVDRNSTIPASASKQKKITVDLFHNLSVNINMFFSYVCLRVQMSPF